jgi:anti-sigma regulatory factor (Ser/Thr protein kinase)
VTALRHNAFLYSSTDEYVERAVAFLREGIRSGEGAVVAHTRPGLAVMREALGDDAERTTFVDVSAAYTRPAHTLAAYHRVYADQLSAVSSLRAVADVQIGPEPHEWDAWVAYEAVFNRSFAHLPAWVLCSYDTDAIPDPVLESVWRTHPQVVAGRAWSDSERFEEPERALRRLGGTAAPLSGLRSIDIGSDAETLRERLAAELVAAAVPEARVLDMLLAATEVADNARRHGGGVVDARVGTVSGRFVCEIVDRGGGFDDPTAGYLAPRPGTGSGLWVARQLAWDLEFLRTPAGFAARIWL